LESLTAKWRQTEHFGLPLDNELADRCQGCTAWLQGRIRLADKRRRARVLIVTLLILGSIGAAVPAALDWSRQREFLASLDGFQSGRRVADTQAVVRRIPAKLKTKPKMADGLSKAEQFISRELSLKEGFDRKLAALQQSLDAGSPVEQAGARRAECEKAIATLAPEFQPPARSALAAWDSKWEAVRNGELSSRLAGAEQIAAGLNAAGGLDAVRAAVSQLQGALAGMDILLAQPPPVDAARDAKYRELAANAAHWSGVVQDWDATQASLQQAPGVEEYLQTLDHLAESPFAAAAQRDAVAEISRLRINEPTLLGELLLPDDKDAWDSLTNTASWRPAFMPGQPSAQEKEAYLKLRDDKNMQDIYAYELVTNSRPGNPFQTHPVFAQGLITPDRAGQESGLIYDPMERRNAPHFMQQAYSDWDYVKVTKLFRTQECDAYERLGLGEWIDSNTGNYQKPMLQLFDQLSQDDNSSAIFRAFVTMKLYELARMRPLDWGLQWAPDAARNIRKLQELGAGELQSGDWMARSQVAKHEKELQMVFAGARTVSLEKEAQFLRQLARQTCEQGFLFAGFVGLDGAPVLRRIIIPGAEYWGWDARSSTAGLLFRRASNGGNLEKLGEPMPCTPLLVFPGDRRKILLDARQAAGATAAVLPPFFSGL
jgi:Tfp pilus assembly protein FimT